MKGARMIFDTAGSDSDLKKYDGKVCVVLRPLTKEEADIELEEIGPMYRIVFEDGREADAFEEELRAA